MNTFLPFLVLCVLACYRPLQSQTDTDLRKKCPVTVTWKLNGEDATVTVTVKNGTKKTLVDPLVRVRFYNKDGLEVSSDAKGYSATIRPGASKKLEARIWRSISPESAKATGEVEYCIFEM